VIPATVQAAAIPPHTYSGTFAGSGSHAFTDPSTVVIDQASDSVYVADRGNDRVIKLDTQGNFILMFGDQVNDTTDGDVCTAVSGDTCQVGQNGSGPGQFSNITALGVDNSEGPSAGSIYVGDDGNGRIVKYTPSGERVTDFAGSGALVLPNFHSMTVDHEGFVYVLEDFHRFGRYDHRGINDRYAPLVGDLGTSVSDVQMAIDSLRMIAFSNGFVNGRKAYGLGELRADTSLPQFTLGGSGYGVDPATDDLYASKGNRIEIFSKTCDSQLGECTPTEVFGTGEIAGAEGVAVHSASGRVFAATNTGLAYFDATIAPDVHPGAPATYTPDSATVHAEVDPAGGGDVTSCEVEYGTTPAYGSTAPCDQTLPLTTPATISTTLTGLTAETAYYYRFAAGNDQGNGYGAEGVVTPHHVPEIETDPASNLSAGGATLNGSFNPAEDPTNYYFEWGLTPAYGNVTSVPPGDDVESGSGVVSVSADLVGSLTSMTTYHFRLVATNSSGISYGEDRTFVTDIPLLPLVQETFASSVTPTSAVFNSTVLPGFGPTAYRFQYGATPAFDQSTVFGGSIGNDNNAYAVTDQVSGLEPDTAYQFRTIAINFGGTTKGQTATFVTPDRPQVEGVSAHALSPTSAAVSSNVSANLAATTVSFGYGSTSPAEATTSTLPLGAQDGGIHESGTTIGGLVPNTTYFVQSFAENQWGKSQSGVTSFRTPGLPPEAEPPRRAKRCQRGFVKKRGKCVRKKRHKTRKKARARQGGGRRG
jgi:hypothetical protein